MPKIKWGSAIEVAEAEPKAEENTWNQNNVGENLKEWLKSMENTQIVSDYTDR